MAVVFTSTIMMDETGDKWFIELKDMVDDRVAICHNMDEYVAKVEEFGNDYGGNIDAVNWYKDPDVPVQVMDEIRFAMAEQQAEIEAKTGEPLIKDEKK
jgi:hypothetical protein